MNIRTISFGAMGVCLAIACAATACPPSAAPISQGEPVPVSQSPQADNALVTIRREGGFCYPPGCFSDVTIYPDGTYRYSNSVGDRAAGRIRWGALQQLRSRIARADFDQIRSETNVRNPIPNLCLLASDGPEAVYRFYQSGQVEEIRGCETDIDRSSRLFQQLETLYGRISEQAAQPAPNERRGEQPTHTGQHGTTGQSDFFEEGDRPRLGSLPLSAANAVMRDAQARLLSTEAIAHNSNAPIGLRADSIERISWNECGGGPSQPMRGICPNVIRQGWRMVVAGTVQQELFQLVYYLPLIQGTEADEVPSLDLASLQPDGLQSIPQAVRSRVLAVAAQQTGEDPSQIQIHWVESHLLERCEGDRSANLGCQAGWSVEVLGGRAEQHSLSVTRWVFQSNLLGTEIRLVSRGNWAPPPAAPPTTL
ncbi:MAG: hypothetical protein OHK0037_09540 [Elainellaceae cyanobacterium]